MRKLSLLSLFFAIIFFGTFSIAKAQGDPPPVGQEFVPPRRPNLLQELGLSKEQIQQLRRFNADFQPQMREAQRNLKEANQALDEAIYGDEANDEIIKEKVRAVQQAQAEVIRHRAFMETSIRRILTKDQLIKFRQLRQEFKMKKGNPNNRLENPNKIRNPNKLENQNPNNLDRPFRKRLGRPNQRPAN